MTQQPALNDPAAYIDELVLQLRLLDVPGARIGHILAETESHLAESGEDPVRTFGPPHDYARELAEREGVTLPRVSRSPNVLVQLFSSFTARDWVTLVAGTVAFGAAMFVGLGGILHLLFGSPVPFGLHPWLAIGIAAVVAVAWLVWVRTVSDPIVDPRSGREVEWDRKGRRTPHTGA